MRDARVFLGSGGGDGVDTAAKLARRYWQETGAPERDVLVVRTNAYHGTHGYGTSLAGIPANRTSWGPLVPDVSIVAHDSVDALRAEVERLGADRVAAVFVEPVIGAGGVHPPVEGYLEGVAELCRRDRDPARLRQRHLRLRAPGDVVRDRALGRRRRT